MGATFFAAIAAFAVGIICFSSVIYIIDVIGMFKVFEKCGLEGWKAIIPFYNDYVFSEKVWVPKYVLYFWIAAIVNWVIVSPISQSGGFIGNTVFFGRIYTLDFLYSCERKILLLDSKIIRI